MKELTEQKIKCTECGSWANPKTFKVEGFEVRGWQCKKCKEIYYSDDINKVLMIRKLRKQPIMVKIGVLGVSEFLRIPKELVTMYDIEKGERVAVYPETPKKFVVEIKD